jgi:hypothetical protein
MLHDNDFQLLVLQRGLAAPPTCLTFRSTAWRNDLDGWTSEGEVPDDFTEPPDDQALPGHGDHFGRH